MDRGAEVDVLVAGIARASQELARVMPAPRGGPFFGLDLPVVDPATLDTFSGEGIFRKYQRVLVLRSGLGGAVRWWATRLGCRVVGIDPWPQLAGAAARLSERAGAGGAAQFCAGRLEAFPFADACCTHVWSVDGLGAANGAAVLAEAFRVLRPAGLVLWRFPGGAVESGAAGLVEQARHVGFVSVSAHEAPRAEPPHYLAGALKRLRVAVAETMPATDVSALLQWAGGPRGSDDPPALHLRAQRPS